MATRNVVLTDAQSALVDELVESGRFQNASEALRAGLRLLQEDEAERSALRDRLVLGVEEARQENFAEGNGEEAMKRAFAEARSKS
ncbi:MAG: type II toxin-antitoxin system ParD family antitoxin [Maricaulis sp.]|uniref:type II toxin-antitoxin system ParD family antitoxin n=1 Tax=Maricaulis sp. TaxID=1486257 RepID=UPI001B139683|nr:type II toxin-antitoxin system ParD family antitoxin [Maricaulis sp.]MBO6729326.1 type II toxin-antitoxin system ParD family antitoxin [Maricaulis sp.]MBO6846719.1 type II toxin-antitoxin system ParD family antitoxin [Maricaulis sp.]MBO6878785.1 type II toxin-antitoxin system ParD family antitoxin [Maricaulis sp.]